MLLLLLLLLLPQPPHPPAYRPEYYICTTFSLNRCNNYLNWSLFLTSIGTILPVHYKYQLLSRRLNKIYSKEKISLSFTRLYTCSVDFYLISSRQIPHITRSAFLDKLFDSLDDYRKDENNLVNIKCVHINLCSLQINTLLTNFFLSPLFYQAETTCS